MPSERKFSEQDKGGLARVDSNRVGTLFGLAFGLRPAAP